MTTAAPAPDRVQIAELDYFRAVEKLVLVEREKSNFKTRATYETEKAKARQVAAAKHGVLCTVTGRAVEPVHETILGRVW